MPLCGECVSSNLWHGRYQRAGVWVMFWLCSVAQATAEAKTFKYELNEILGGGGRVVWF